MGEIVMKLIAYRLHFFCELWNLFDLVIVCLTSFTMVASSELPLDLKLLRLVRLLRLLKLVSSLRSVHAFHSLYLMFAAVRQSVFILGWACISLVIIQMLFSLLITECLHAFYFCNGPLSESSGSGVLCESLTSSEEERQRAVYMYYGTFVRSIFSMFELTLANWPPAARVLADNIHWSFMPLAVVHKLVFGFAVIGVIQSVIMKETFKVAEQDDQIMLWSQERQVKVYTKKMRDFFVRADTHHDGKITMEEFRKVMEHEQIRTWLASMEVNASDVDQMFALLDTSKNGALEIEELVKGINRLKGAARSIDLVAMMDMQSRFFDQVRNRLGLDESVASFDVGCEAEERHGIR